MQDLITEKKIRRLIYIVIYPKSFIPPAEKEAHENPPYPSEDALRSFMMSETEISVNCRYLGEWETLTGKIVGVKTKNDGFLVKLAVNTNKSCIDWTKCDIWLSKTGEPSGVLISDPD
ncbi:MAG: hypothetical protein A3G52_04230 [Candidatus Taylorbacteria bacterium RIFCSPLOWO2_12_FULL_43_20]|uniref:Uncharacterized protein n=1 Tax=Candidatus Taylorbacteria bacterium RIFCSPLOWO2_12_FULL_43_20 TaxID=1802332 RepID=A0A1G2P2A1_9BACT|nr:MAG: hypothetical protein A2825_01365 [Candidatus Taylorbacteria bacterium RIFCSPHIGHO2_01_FULL_43_120]OHA22490.1 MAG: hypothetical protein A3B98_00875 [Candidatus Taylorbacteria bacterium RIFCSPHIGHO2_02_FULL_43_55]OHA28380.1 MAG: hypothetical protein A3E92_01665 [Candidatus Taylorbacteria bacterium RIFCSPHIGHO2_12_FULL_42_34]OHA30501.1 MAG: hypothetical protein A3B09_00630 [Candidatus Taylorbacteria bacterium RIFCSPLOWO2_01_FULL_43_83]OHA38085.1 MAG: hypothetical protein A3H58_01735 [Candi